MTETNPSLTEFLLARFAARERAARKCLAEWDRPGMERMLRLSPDSPRFILADVEAKRRIVERCSAVDYAMPSTHLAHGILAELAQPYAAHPEFRGEWAL